MTTDLNEIFETEVRSLMDSGLISKDLSLDRTCGTYGNQIIGSMWILFNHGYTMALTHHVKKLQEKLKGEV